MNDENFKILIPAIITLVLFLQALSFPFLPENAGL